MEPIVKIVYLPRLKVPYPPVKAFIADNLEIAGLWKDHLANNRPLDPRVKKGQGETAEDEEALNYPVVVLDKSLLKYDVKDGENDIFCDEETRDVVGLVIHDLLEEDVMRNINGCIIDHLNKINHSLRQNEPGLIVGLGYT